MITQDLQSLRQVSDDVTIDEVDDIISKLEKELDKCKHGVGLSAIQIGIPKNVCVIKYEEGFMHLINPKVVDEEDPFVFIGEGCLSMPGIYIDTNRYTQVTITTDVVDEDNDKLREETWSFYWDGSDLTPIAVQHEIDHCNGILIMDREAKRTDRTLKKATEKVGRNDPCPCGKLKPDGTPVKYKKCCAK